MRIVLSHRQFNHTSAKYMVQVLYQLLSAELFKSKKESCGVEDRSVDISPVY